MYMVGSFEKRGKKRKEKKTCLILSILNYDRLSVASEVIHHPWIQNKAKGLETWLSG